MSAEINARRAFFGGPKMWAQKAVHPTETGKQLPQTHQLGFSVYQVTQGLFGGVHDHNSGHRDPTGAGLGGTIFGSRIQGVSISSLMNIVVWWLPRYVYNICIYRINT